MAKAIERLSDLTPDSMNANRGTQRGTGMLERSLAKYGAGRSILTNKNGKILAGNKTAEQAAVLGLEIETVHTVGDKLVVVVRDDLEDDDPRANELAIADNRVSELNLDWEPEILQALSEDGVDLAAFWRDDELAEVLRIVPEFDPVGIEEQGRLDEKAPVTCPECGHVFTT